MKKEDKLFFKAVLIGIILIVIFRIITGILNYFFGPDTNYWHMVIVFILARTIMHDLEHKEK